MKLKDVLLAPFKLAWRACTAAAGAVVGAVTGAVAGVGFALKTLASGGPMIIGGAIAGFPFTLGVLFASAVVGGIYGAGGGAFLGARDGVDGVLNTPGAVLDADFSKKTIDKREFDDFSPITENSQKKNISAFNKDDTHTNKKNEQASKVEQLQSKTNTPSPQMNQLSSPVVPPLAQQPPAVTQSLVTDNNQGQNVGLSKTNTPIPQTNQLSNLTTKFTQQQQVAAQQPTQHFTAVQNATNEIQQLAKNGLESVEKFLAKQIKSFQEQVQKLPSCNQCKVFNSGGKIGLAGPVDHVCNAAKQLTDSGQAKGFKVSGASVEKVKALIERAEKGGINLTTVKVGDTTYSSVKEFKEKALGVTVEAPQLKDNRPKQP